ncbi:ABC transporter permease [Xylanimonas ulmi]|uniref:Putative ABC transport system permease protein n=1 Tax=Xylanimonas ulmi TaxID=228973 RepID=A0A4Q7M0U9_9MICO|nr:ABC transporter permease [Xylanibacterium ulmi]RZS60377.1 putative ABC transport system permease protein [Xylanibacterium ulmi]
MPRRLTPADLLRTAGLGVTGRPQRTGLAALGVALGIASLVALTGAAASNHAELLRAFDALGADLAVVRPGVGPDREPVPLPDAAPEAIARHDGVDLVGVFETAPPGADVRRTDLVPATETGGLTVAVARPDVLAAVGAELDSGRWFDDATRAMPVTVLGSTAASRLGVEQAGGRVWIAGQWHGVLGVLADSGLAGGVIDTAAILGDRWVRDAFGDEDGVGQIAEVYVRAEPGRVEEVREVLASAARPGAPHLVSVTGLSDLVTARETTDDALAALGLALGGIALLVGGVGIANTMVVAVLERRGEIGLRRALGARPGQIAAQFVTEAVALSALGGAAGLALGVAAAAVIAWSSGQSVVIPQAALLAGPAASIAVGALAGLHPAVRAARVPPTTALRAT